MIMIYSISNTNVIYFYCLNVFCKLIFILQFAFGMLFFSCLKWLWHVLNSYYIFWGKGYKIIIPTKREAKAIFYWRIYSYKVYQSFVYIYIIVLYFVLIHLILLLRWYHIVYLIILSPIISFFTSLSYNAVDWSIVSTSNPIIVLLIIAWSSSFWGGSLVELIFCTILFCMRMRSFILKILK